MSDVLKKLPFITPSAPVLKTAPPRGDGWLHEVKFDGWRAQLHKDGDAVTIYSRNGKDLTERFSFVRDSIAALPASSAIIDAELVACDDDGKPDFGALMARTSNSGNVCAAVAYECDATSQKLTLRCTRHQVLRPSHC
jgi:bifunctional non-homologous end joining protein LigD